MGLDRVENLITGSEIKIGIELQIHIRKSQCRRLPCLARPECGRDQCQIRQKPLIGEITPDIAAFFNPARLQRPLEIGGCALRDRFAVTKKNEPMHKDES